MENTTILENYSAEEKKAYLTAIASLATADRQATEDEIDCLRQLSEAMALNEADTAYVVAEASDPSAQRLAESLTALQNSELRYSLLTDMIALGKIDHQYTPEEQQAVDKIATYLGINREQYQVLNQFADKATVADTQESNAGIQNAFGLGDKLSSLGINKSSLLKGLLSIAAPLILSKIFNRRSGSAARPAGAGGGMFGGILGSVIGKLGTGSGLGGGILGKIIKGL